MTDKTLSTVVGSGGGEFIASMSYSAEVISSGATGTFKTLTPPLGKKIKITLLRSSAVQTNLLTVTVDGVDVVSAVKLDASLGGTILSNEYTIFEGVNFIIGDVDEVIELKTNIATTSDIYLMYQEGS